MLLVERDCAPVLGALLLLCLQPLGCLARGLDMCLRERRKPSLLPAGGEHGLPGGGGVRALKP